MWTSKVLPSSATFPEETEVDHSRCAADTGVEEEAAKVKAEVSGIFNRGVGIRLFTEDNIEYIDAASGTFNLALGYDHPSLVKELREQVGKLVHMSSHFTEPYVADLLRQLLKDAPAKIDAGWMRDITGSTANECAVKVAQKYTGATDVISLFLSHHGQTLFTTGISGNAFRRAEFPNASAGNGICVPGPYCFRCHYKSTYPRCDLLCADAIADFIEYASSGSVACMIVEPVLGNGGNIVPPPGYFKRLRQICDEHQILLIADEVQTGLGRTGFMYASTSMDIQPNIITLAKGLGGIGVPVGAVLMEERINGLQKHEHSFTSGSNMLSLVAAKKTVEVLSEPGFLENVRKNGELLGKLLQGLKKKHGCIGDVRGIGLMWGLEIVSDHNAPDSAKTTAIVDRAFEAQRLILRGSRYGFGNVVKVRPALVSTQDDLTEIVDRLSKTISSID